MIASGRDVVPAGFVTRIVLDPGVELVSTLIFAVICVELSTINELGDKPAPSKKLTPLTLSS